MENRKKTIEEIMESFQVMKNKVQNKFFHSADNNLVTFSQWFVLVIIEQYRGIGIKEISSKLGISSSAATQLVDGLVDNGYAKRNDDPKDRRALQLKLSSKGKKYIIAKEKKHTKNMEKFFNVLNDRELAAFLRLHKKILSNIL